MNAIIARIFLRYLAGALVAKGIIDSQVGSELMADPEIGTMVLTVVDFIVSTLPGLVVGAASEVWYFFARKFGWTR